MTTLRLVRRCTIAGRRLTAGSRVELPAEKAQRLIDQGAARIERDDERDAVDPGIDCWGLRAVGSGFILDVLSELEMVTRHASEPPPGPIQKKYMHYALNHCAEAWRLVGKGEQKCRAFLGARPSKRELLVNTPPLIVRLRDQRGLWSWFFSDVRKEVVLAQSDLNATLYDDMRPGRKTGTKSIALPVLRKILTETLGPRGSIKQVVSELSKMAARPDAEQRQGSTTLVHCKAPGSETFDFECLGRKNRHNRRAIEGMLVALRKSLDAETKILRGYEIS